MKLENTETKIHNSPKKPPNKNSYFNDSSGYFVLDKKINILPELKTPAKSTEIVNSDKSISRKWHQSTSPLQPKHDALHALS